MKNFIKAEVEIKNEEVQDLCLEMQGNISHLLLLLVEIINALKLRGLSSKMIESVVKLGLMQDEVKKAKKEKDLDNIFEKIMKDLD